MAEPAASRVGVLGAGSWGTTLALHLARKGETVTLWDGDAAHVARLEAEGRNERHVPGEKFPPSITVTPWLEDACGGPVVIFAVPAAAMTPVAESVAKAHPEWAGLPVTVAKGFEGESGRRMSQVLAGALPAAASRRVVALAGPSLAREVAGGLPVTLVAAGPEAEAREVQALFSGRNMRVYTNPDIAGVEYAGALKNIIAIAAGILDGMGLGDNARGALITRGLAEMVRLGTALGSRAESFYGLCGVGDLVTTCSSRLSRNHQVGERLAGGQKLEAILQELGQVAEGVPAARAAVDLARRAGVEMPIAQQVHEVLFSGKDPRRALDELMSRGLKPEVNATR
ncbi:MAG: NAD(P)-dependent glycerol-3-phosphate dehydrogenase [Candidatus Eisenbacteria bacterium]|nr:NAD(P)-dependent glycerol-3-phosphate dehydrogenase [Candidatus Eisenbacteria bacterium]